MSYCNSPSANVNQTPLEAFVSVLKRPEPRAFVHHHDEKHRLFSAIGIVVPSEDTAQRVVRSLGIEHVISKLQYEEEDDITNGISMLARGEVADGLFEALDALDAWFYVGEHYITAFRIRTNDTPLFYVQWYARYAGNMHLYNRQDRIDSDNVINRYRGDIRAINGVYYSVTGGSDLRGLMQTIATENMYRNASWNAGNE